jgi:hypothetical protein
MNPRSLILLICGIPASGKTTFGNWLRDNHNFVHLDLELRDCLAANGLPQFWPDQRIWNLDSTELRLFIRHLHSLDRNTVMTWGFHTDLIALVQEMVSAGVTAWWFEADRLAARQRFAARQTIIRNGVLQPGTADPARFDDTVGSLVRQWAQIAPIFDGHVIRTLGADGNYLRPAAIFDRMQGAAGS